MVALAAGRDAFCDYSNVFSPHKFTQPQLFACLVLKEFEKKDYRGITQFLIGTHKGSGVFDSAVV